MSTIQNLTSIIEWPFRAIVRGESQLDKYLSLFPFFDLFHFIKAVRTNRTATGNATLSLPLLSNDPVFTLHRLKLTVDELGDTGHVSDNSSFHEAIHETDQPEVSDNTIETPAITNVVEPVIQDSVSQISEPETTEQHNDLPIPVTPADEASLEVETVIEHTAPLVEADIIPALDQSEADPIPEQEVATQIDHVTDSDETESEDAYEADEPEDHVQTHSPEHTAVPQRWTLISGYRPVGYAERYTMPATTHYTVAEEETPEHSPFLAWIRSTVQNPASDESISSNQKHTEQPEKKKSAKKLALEAVVKDSVRDHNYLVTEQYAELLYAQGYLERSKNIYQKLMDKFPEKSAIFASKIEQINNEII